jgi:drug/metabolite transporter superfamily protein YnfA
MDDHMDDHYDGYAYDHMMQRIMTGGVLTFKLLLFGLTLVVFGGLLHLNAFSSFGSSALLVGGMLLSGSGLLTGNHTAAELRQPVDTATLMLMLSGFIHALRLLLFGLLLVIAGGALHFGVLGGYGGIFVVIGLTFGLLGLIVNRSAPYRDDPWYEYNLSLDLGLGLLGLGFLTRDRAKNDRDNLDPE